MDCVAEFLSLLPPTEAALYGELARRAMDLGFRPRREKTKHPGVSFTSSRYKATILKFSWDKQLSFRLKFFASSDYPELFDRSIKAILEKYNFKYVGCYGCGKCSTSPAGTSPQREGYQVRYPDGKEFFRCGFELVEIQGLPGGISPQATQDTLVLMDAQVRYWEEKIQRTKLTPNS